MKKLAIAFLVLLSVFAFSACAKSPQEDDTRATAMVEPETANPEGALTEIYENSETKGISPATDKDMEEVFGFDLSIVEEYFVMFSEGGYGVEDTYIIKPVPGKAAEVKTTLENLQDEMIRQYESYDIHNSYALSQDAVVFEQGDYVVMLMHEDTDAVRTIIDKYIPSK